jgi:hypothetical protein
MQAELFSIYLWCAELVETAGNKQSARKSTKPPFPRWFVKRRVNIPHRGRPGKRQAPIATRRDVKRSIAQHIEYQSASSSNLQDSHSSLGSVSGFEQTNPSNLLDSPDALQ